MKESIKEGEVSNNDSSYGKIDKCYLVLGILPAIGLVVFIVFIILGSVYISDKKGGNGRNVGINYVRKYYPPLTSKD